MARSRFQTREEGSFGVNHISVFVLSKIDIPVLVSSIVQPFMVRSARPNRFLVRIELGNVYDGKSMCPVLVGIRSVPLPVELIIAPLAVLTWKCWNGTRFLSIDAFSLRINTWSHPVSAIAGIEGMDGPFEV